MRLRCLIPWMVLLVQLWVWPYAFLAVDKPFYIGVSMYMTMFFTAVVNLAWIAYWWD